MPAPCLQAVGRPILAAVVKASEPPLRRPVWAAGVEQVSERARRRLALELPQRGQCPRKTEFRWWHTLPAEAQTITVVRIWPNWLRKVWRFQIKRDSSRHSIGLPTWVVKRRMRCSARPASISSRASPQAAGGGFESSGRFYLRKNTALAPATASRATFQNLSRNTPSIAKSPSFFAAMPPTSAASPYSATLSVDEVKSAWCLSLNNEQALVGVDVKLAQSLAAGAQKRCDPHRACIADG